MGNSHPQQPSFILDARSAEDWVKVQEQGYCELWMNKTTSKQLQAYPIPQSFVRNQEQLQKYHFRKAHRENLVVVEAIITPGNSSFCSEPRTAYALVQNITGRLSQFRHCLSFEQALYVLSAAASGYNTLNSFFGPLEPHAEMVCFNDEGEVKIWLNENLALNEPSQSAKPATPPSDDYNVAQRRTKEGVSKLIKIVEEAAINEFSFPFSEECKKLSTYFQTANMVSYFCYANGIELPSKVIVFKHLQNPSIHSQKMLNKQQSNHSFQGKVTSLESSRVKTVVFKGSQIQQKDQLFINPPFSRPLLPQPAIQFKSDPRLSQKVIQSPKITFSIRSTLPSHLNQQKVERVQFGKPVLKINNPLPNFARGSGINPFNLQQPRNQIKYQEVRRNKPVVQNDTSVVAELKSQQPKKQIQSIVQPQKNELEFHQQKTSQVESRQQQRFVERDHAVEQKPSTLTTFVEPHRQPHQIQANAQSLKTETIVQSLDNLNSSESSPQKSPNSNQNLPNQQNEVYDYEEQEPQDNTIKETGYFYLHKEEPKPFNRSREYQNQYGLYGQQSRTSQEQKKSVKAEAIEDLRKLVYEEDYPNSQQDRVQSYNNLQLAQNQQNYEDQEKYQTEEHQDHEDHMYKMGQEGQNPSHLHPQKYNNYRYEQSPIIEQLEENFSSPPKDNTEIEEWQARLTKFTQSRHSHNELQVKIFESTSFPDKVYAPSVEFRREELQKQSKEEPANEMAHLDEGGIQDYIRKKYNIYNQPSASNEASYHSKESSYHSKEPTYSSKEVTYHSREASYPSKITSTKQRTSYRNESERPTYAKTLSDDYFYEKPSYKSNILQPSNEATIYRQHARQPYQKENYYPRQQQDYTYQPSNRLSVELSPETFANRYSYADDTEDKYVRKEAERPRYRASQMSKIDQRYNKYVVNGNRAKQSSLLNKSTLSKDVILILGGQDNKISRFSSKPAFSEIEESRKRGQNAFVKASYNPSSGYKNDVTYEKLRNLLWQQ